MRCRRRLTPSSVPFLGPHSATRRLTGVLARMTIDSRADQATFAATRLRESRVPPTTTTTTTTTTTMTTTTTTATATAIDSIHQTFVIPPSTRPPMIDDRKRRFALSFGLSFVDSTRCSTPASLFRLAGVRRRRVPSLGYHSGSLSSPFTYTGRSAEPGNRRVYSRPDRSSRLQSGRIVDVPRDDTTLQHGTAA